jgi:hypothetical protein
LTNIRPPVTGRDVAGAGALLLAANALCVMIGLGIGLVIGQPIWLAVAGLLIGFPVGVRVVARRFRDL